MLKVVVMPTLPTTTPTEASMLVFSKLTMLTGTIVLVVLPLVIQAQTLIVLTWFGDGEVIIGLFGAPAVNVVVVTLHKE